MAFLDTSERTTYRYLDLLKELGFTVEKDFNGRYAITNADVQMPLFSEDEIEFLKKLLHTTAKSHKLAQSILQKFALNNEADTNADNLFNAHLAKIIEQISVAMAENKQIKIKGYFSASSETITDRIVEPVCFTDNYQSLSAYEIKTKQNKYFNLERIGNIEILPKSITHQSQHQFFKPDIFGFQGKTLDKEIEMVLSLRAYIILKDDYPMSIPYITKHAAKNSYLLKAQVQSFKAPARFVKGLEKDIEVLGSKAFINYLKKIKSD
jgi:proteasome accessory factor C